MTVRAIELARDGWLTHRRRSRAGPGEKHDLRRGTSAHAFVAAIVRAPRGRVVSRSSRLPWTSARGLVARLLDDGWASAADAVPSAGGAAAQAASSRACAVALSAAEHRHRARVGAGAASSANPDRARHGCGLSGPRLAEWILARWEADRRLDEGEIQP